MISISKNKQAYESKKMTKLPQRKVALLAISSSST